MLARPFPTFIRIQHCLGGREEGKLLSIKDARSNIFVNGCISTVAVRVWFDFGLVIAVRFQFCLVMVQ